MGAQPVRPPQTTIEALAQAAARFGDREALVDGDVRMDFETLRTEVHDVARALLALEVPRGARVALWAPNTYHWVLVALAAHCAGATLVPINTRFTGHEALDVVESLALARQPQRGAAHLGRQTQRSAQRLARPRQRDRAP